MNKAPADITWLPPQQEWDFRSVTRTECRVACHWEYSREIERMLGTAAVAGRKVSSEASFRLSDVTPLAALKASRRDKVTKSPLFPRPWTALTAGERTSVMAAVEPLPALQMRTLNQFLARSGWALGKNAAPVAEFTDGAYVFRPDFTGRGVEVVIREFEKWARKEAKNYTRSPRAKAAELPFDLLKWLSVFRVDTKRREVGLTYERTQEALKEYRRRHTRPDPDDVFPAYASHGAWSKARNEAERVRQKVMSNPSMLLRDHYW
jgi:hypothetical protein